MPAQRTGELLTLFLLLAGALSTSFTLRAAGNYVHLYEALGSLELRTVNQTYSLGPGAPTVFVTLLLRNPTPYEGLVVESFYFTPKYFQSPSSRFLLGFDTYSLKLLSDVQVAALPAESELNLRATVVINNKLAASFLLFYQNQTVQPTLVYDASLRVHSTLDGYCAMRIYLEAEGSRVTCGTGSFGQSDVGL